MGKRKQKSAAKNHENSPVPPEPKPVESPVDQKPPVTDPFAPVWRKTEALPLGKSLDFADPLATFDVAHSENGIDESSKINSESLKSGETGFDLEKSGTIGTGSLVEPKESGKTGSIPNNHDSLPKDGFKKANVTSTSVDFPSYAVSSKSGSQEPGKAGTGMTHGTVGPELSVAGKGGKVQVEATATENERVTVAVVSTNTTVTAGQMKRKLPRSPEAANAASNALTLASRSLSPSKVEMERMSECLDPVVFRKNAYGQGSNFSHFDFAPTAEDSQNVCALFAVRFPAKEQPQENAKKEEKNEKA